MSFRRIAASSLFSSVNLRRRVCGTQSSHLVKIESSAHSRPARSFPRSAHDDRDVHATRNRVSHVIAHTVVICEVSLKVLISLTRDARNRPTTHPGAPPRPDLRVFPSLVMNAIRKRILRVLGVQGLPVQNFGFVQQFVMKTEDLFVFGVRRLRGSRGHFVEFDGSI